MFWETKELLEKHKNTTCKGDKMTLLAIVPSVELLNLISFVHRRRAISNFYFPRAHTHTPKSPKKRYIPEWAKTCAFFCDWWVMFAILHTPTLPVVIVGMPRIIRAGEFPGRGRGRMKKNDTLHITALRCLRC